MRHVVIASSSRPELAQPNFRRQSARLATPRPQALTRALAIPPLHGEGGRDAVADGWGSPAASPPLAD